MLRFNGINPASNDRNSGGNVIRLGGGRFKLPGWLFYPFVAVLSLWVFAYGSGLFPYMGYKSGGYKTLPVAGRVSYGIGDNDHLQVHRIFLFSGQTAIVDYDVTVRKGELEIEVIEGIITLREPLVEQAITDSAKGRVAVKVPSTGLYTIIFRPSIQINEGRPGEPLETDLDYTLWWGGLFGE